MFTKYFEKVVSGPTHTSLKAKNKVNVKEFFLSRPNESIN